MEKEKQKDIFKIIAECTDGNILFEKLPDDALADIEFILIQRNKILEEFEEKGYFFDYPTSYEPTKEYLMLKNKIDYLESRNASAWYYGSIDTQELIDYYLDIMKDYSLLPNKIISLYISKQSEAKEPLKFVGSIDMSIPCWESTLCLCLLRLKEAGYIDYNFTTSFTDKTNFFGNVEYNLCLDEINYKFNNLHAVIK